MTDAATSVSGAAGGATFGSVAGPIGTVLGGIGGFISGLFGSDGPAGMTPEAQYELERMKLDVSQFTANWGKTMDIYNMSVQNAQNEAYTSIYGGAEQAAGEYAQSAYAGELTPGAQKGINDLGMQLGNQSNLSEQDIINQAITSGRSLDSPDVQAQLAQAKSGVRSAFATGQGTIMSSDYQNSVANANNIIAAGKSGRISGVNVSVPGTTSDTNASGLTKATTTGTSTASAFDPGTGGSVPVAGPTGTTSASGDLNLDTNRSSYGGQPQQLTWETTPEGSKYGQKILSLSEGAQSGNAVSKQALSSTQAEAIAKKNAWYSSLTPQQKYQGQSFQDIYGNAQTMGNLYGQAGTADWNKTQSAYNSGLPQYQSEYNSAFGGTA